MHVLFDGGKYVGMQYSMLGLGLLSFTGRGCVLQRRRGDEETTYLTTHQPASLVYPTRAVTHICFAVGPLHSNCRPTLLCKQYVRKDFPYETKLP